MNEFSYDDITKLIKEKEKVLRVINGTLERLKLKYNIYRYEYSNEPTEANYKRVKGMYFNIDYFEFERVDIECDIEKLKSRRC